MLAMAPLFADVPSFGMGLITRMCFHSKAAIFLAKGKSIGEGGSGVYGHLRLNLLREIPILQLPLSHLDSPISSQYSLRCSLKFM